ncbi:hypothetical protein DEI20_23935 [Salmonella enterica subsp. enterica serovar Newport]|nr:hypothetical protein [Salmonella enterica subsp. enterica serovar Newport]MJR82333.1 hypothetical protein [Salmonella enterica subsp. enterica serovar Newport]HAE2415112.1 hypothetical protein [Salmonella enterica subsp. enterica serovar Newport]
MNASNDKAEYGPFSSPEDIAGQETVADERGGSVPQSAREMSLADFARRVRACETYRRLDMLHTLLLRTVPVGRRADYIALLNQRDEELSFQETGMAWQVYVHDR